MEQCRLDQASTKNTHEGMRRVCTVIGAVLAVSWVIFAAVGSEGFKWMQWWQWLIFVAGIIVSYLIPFYVHKLFRWVREGFES
jgi:putative flippase GtrA